MGSDRLRAGPRAATRPAFAIGSHTEENGGAYARSRLASSSTFMPAVTATARVSMRMAEPLPPTI